VAVAALLQRDAAADMMAEARSALEYSNCLTVEDANCRMSRG
jgi:hypothetical protein